MKINVKGKYPNWWLCILPPNGSIANIAQTSFVTSPFLPEVDVNMTKKSVFQDYPVPGLDYTPFQYVRSEDTRISLKLPIIDKNYKNFGNSLKLYQIERMGTVTQDINPLNIFKDSQFRTPPICLYSGYGTTLAPGLPCVVENGLELISLRDHINQYGLPTFSYVTINLRFIEGHKLWKAWRYSKLILSQIKSVQSLASGSKKLPV